MSFFYSACFQVNNMNHTLKLPSLAAALLAALLALPCAGHAASQEDIIKANIEQFTGGKVNAEKVTPSPAQGIWQVESEGEIFYVDASGRYGIVGGRMVDMSEKKDLTERALAALHSVPFESLPLHLAIKQVNGNGQRKVAVFEDPACPVCRAFAPFADQLENTTLYRFPFPVISPQSAQIVRNAWCAQNRAAAWDAAMRGLPQQGAVPDECDVSGLEAILRFGEQHKIHNTPTMFLGNGKRLVGAVPPEQFMVELEASAQQSAR